jgi:hypothetical protein
MNDSTWEFLFGLETDMLREGGNKVRMAGKKIPVLLDTRLIDV